MHEVLQTIFEALKNSVLITGLVTVMMMLIEYINIHSQGRSFSSLRGSSFKQVILGASLGVLPGCVGGFATVSLFTHGIVSFGALLAMMIASSGDEAFIILAMIPEQAIFIFPTLFLIAIAIGVIVDKIESGRNRRTLINGKNREHLQIHKEECCSHIEGRERVFNGSIVDNLKSISKERLIIILGIAIFTIAVIAGILEHGHEHGEECNHAAHFDILSERWLNLFFAGVSLIIFFLTLKADEHFIKEHLWGHVIKKHFVSIFCWTLGALIIILFGLQYLNLEKIVSDNIVTVILIAALVGLIPESGPHMIFISLFSGGLVPFSVLLTSSIVQDGHTTLPLLAESRRVFIKAKIITFTIGIIVGLSLHLILGL